ncbi:hypothetical protein Bca52824_076509 [Brassica carinata]|uniref:Uncharacterized protein n=1 Tax=Brassica carinata TaxID=52824 RepID=A0A8X7PU04_BRACI|nr:hypothetical protein Bca52824_076509 [Brassica carinata]
MERESHFPSSTTATGRDVALSSNRTTDRERSRLSPRRGKNQREISPCSLVEERNRWRGSFAFDDDSHRERRRRFVEQSHRSQKMSPFATEKEGERERKKKKRDGSLRHLSSSQFHWRCS